MSGSAVDYRKRPVAVALAPTTPAPRQPSWGDTLQSVEMSLTAATDRCEALARNHANEPRLLADAVNQLLQSLHGAVELLGMAHERLVQLEAADKE